MKLEWGKRAVVAASVLLVSVSNLQADQVGRAAFFNGDDAVQVTDTKEGQPTVVKTVQDGTVVKTVSADKSGKITTQEVVDGKLAVVSVEERTVKESKEVNGKAVVTYSSVIKDGSGAVIGTAEGSKESSTVKNVVSGITTKNTKTVSVVKNGDGTVVETTTVTNSQTDSTGVTTEITTIEKDVDGKVTKTEITTITANGGIESSATQIAADGDENSSEFSQKIGEPIEANDPKATAVAAAGELATMYKGKPAIQVIDIIKNGHVSTNIIQDGVLVKSTIVEESDGIVTTTVKELVGGEFKVISIEVDHDHNGEGIAYNIDKPSRKYDNQVN